MMRMPGFCALAAIAIAGNQTAAADRDEQGIEIGSLFEDLQRDRPLTGDDIGVGERVDIGEIFDLGMPQGCPVAVVPDLARHDHMRAPGIELGYFVGGDGTGQEDRRRHPGCPTGVSNRKPVIAARRGDDAATQSLRRQGEDRIDRAARLERAGDLQRFELEQQSSREPGLLP